MVFHQNCSIGTRGGLRTLQSVNQVEDKSKLDLYIHTLNDIKNRFLHPEMVCLGSANIASLPEENFFPARSWMSQ